MSNTNVRIEYNMPFKEYVACNAVHFSTLKNIIKSPKHYVNSVMNPIKTKPHMLFGRAGHTAILEPEIFDTEYCCYEGKRDVRHKRYQEFLAQNPGKFVLSLSEQQGVGEIADAAHKDKLLSGLIEKGKPEVSIFWKEQVGDCYVECKCRVDLLIESGCDAGIYDLKITNNIDSRAFERTVDNFRYDIQSGMYRSGVSKLFEYLPFKFIAMENDLPHDYRIYNQSEELVEYGDGCYRECLGKLVNCVWNKKWPGQMDFGEHELQLVPWRREKVEFDITGLMD